MIIIYIHSHLEDYIADLYKKIGIRRPEQLKLDAVSKKLNIWVYTFGRSSEAVYSNGRQYIFLNRYLSPQEKWQEFGHELCHILRHSGNQRKMHPLFIELQEWQADNFALHFCIPTFMLQQIHLPPEKPQAVRLIADMFNVDYEFACKRLEMYKNKTFAGGYVEWLV